MTLTLTAIVGFALVAMSTAAKLSEGHQIWLNWQRGTTLGVSWPKYLMHGSSYALWVLYGALNFDWWIVAAQGLGVLMCGAVLVQMLTYSNKAKPC
jgi:hypothetical protein